MSRVETLAEGVTLYLGDCREILPTLPKVDAVVTDPPYGINWKPRVSHQDQNWVDRIDFDIKKFLIADYHLFWGGQHFARDLPISNGWLAWVKRPLYCDSRTSPKTYSLVELAWRDWGTAQFISLSWDGALRAGDSDNRTFCHPALKPVEVMEFCVNLLPKQAQLLLDPFMGSGTTGVASVKLGRKFIGVEIEPKYFDIACRRVGDALKQPDLFIKPPAPAHQLSWDEMWSRKFDYPERI